jgi:hypothetical protein
LIGPFALLRFAIVEDDRDDESDEGAEFHDADPDAWSGIDQIHLQPWVLADAAAGDAQVTVSRRDAAGGVTSQGNGSVTGQKASGSAGPGSRKSQSQQQSGASSESGAAAGAETGAGGAGGSKGNKRRGAAAGGDAGVAGRSQQQGTEVSSSGAVPGGVRGREEGVAAPPAGASASRGVGQQTALVSSPAVD